MITKEKDVHIAPTSTNNEYIREELSDLFYYPKPGLVIRVKPRKHIKATTILLFRIGV